MANIKRRIILFADLRGSTALFESIGNEQATSVVTQAITVLARRVPSSAGQLVKTLGDGLMAVFPNADSAVWAALQMHEELEREGHAQPSPHPPLHLQVAITAGEVVEVGGDCFGDAVNVAARLLDHAGDNESLVTREVFDELPGETRARFRHLDKVHVRGRTEPVEVYLLSRRAPTDAAATQLETRADIAEPQGLQLVWRDHASIFSRVLLPVTIGRGSAASVQVDAVRVSRVHARIDLAGGVLQITDLSINGTYVRFTGDDEVLSLRRGGCTLHGSGEIGLGGSPDDERVPVVHFSVLARPTALSKASVTAPAAPPAPSTRLD